MSAYVVIASRDPYTSTEVESTYELAAGLKSAGHEVTLFLVENGVLPARPSVKSAALTRLAKAGVRVLAEEVSLEERGIAKDSLAEGVTAASLELLVDDLGAGKKTFWH